MQNKTKGFTLIELIAVIVIIGILSVIAVDRVGVARDRGMVARAYSDISALNAMLMQFSGHRPGKDVVDSLTDTIGQKTLSSEEIFQVIRASLHLSKDIDTLTKYNAETSEAYTYSFDTTGQQFVAKRNSDANQEMPNVIPVDGSEEKVKGPRAAANSQPRLLPITTPKS